jgi:hypothetical protein
MIFGRVQDYPGQGRFDAHPSVFFIAKTGRYKYLEVTTAGIGTGGITAMNEHGLTMTMHTGITYNTRIENTPGIATTSAIMEEARTMEEAQAVCNRLTPSAGWILNLADTSTGRPRAGWIEVEPSARICHLRITDPGQHLVMTNHYMQLATQAREIRVAVSVDENSRVRRQRALDLIHNVVSVPTDQTSVPGKFSLSNMMALLADRYDPVAGRHIAYGPNVIAAPDQVVAVIFRPETKEVYVSNGWAPPASRGHYVRLSFSDFDDLKGLEGASGRNGDEGRGPVDLARGDLDPRTVLANTPNDLNASMAYEKVTQAMMSLNAHGTFDPALALTYLTQAAELEPSEPLLFFLRGLLQLHLQQFEKARRTLGGAWNMASWSTGGLDHHRAMVTRLNLGKALDVLGRRNEALSHYEAVVADATAHFRVKTAAQYFIQHAATAEDCRRVIPDLKYMDTLNYQ